MTTARPAAESGRTALRLTGRVLTPHSHVLSGEASQERGETDRAWEVSL